MNKKEVKMRNSENIVLLWLFINLFSSIFIHNFLLFNNIMSTSKGIIFSLMQQQFSF
jgi:hypothetical protein